MWYTGLWSTLALVRYVHVARSYIYLRGCPCPTSIHLAKSSSFMEWSPYRAFPYCPPSPPPQPRRHPK